jgi:hypothetical protein
MRNRLHRLRALVFLAAVWLLLHAPVLWASGTSI